MTRIYWRILLIALAVLLLGGGAYISIELHKAAGQRQADYQYQPADDPRLPVAVPGKGQSPPYQPNCNNPQKHRDAQLCADWAAVEQAVEANRLASLNDQITIWIVGLTALGTLAFGLTFYEQRRTSRAELQAYVAVQVKGLPYFAVGEKAVATISIINTGTTPAYEMTQYGTVVIDEFPMKSDPLAERLVRHGVPSRNTLHNREPFGASIEGPMPIIQSAIDDLKAGKKVIYVIGNVDYRDAFKRPRRTEFCYFLSIEAIKAADRQRQKNIAGSKADDPITVRWALGNLHNHAT